MAWHDDHPKYVIENGEPVEAQRGDEPTHVLMPIGTVDAHEAFYNLTVAQRNKAWREVEMIKENQPA